MSGSFFLYFSTCKFVSAVLCQGSEMFVQLNWNGYSLCVCVCVCVCVWERAQGKRHLYY